MGKIKKVVLKENLAVLTGDPIAAIVLNQMLYWSERTRDADKFVLEEQERGGGELSITLMHGWIYKSSEELTEELMGIASISTIRRRLIDLVKNGWIDERNNPKYAWDRTLQYRPNIHKIQRDLMKIGYVLDDYPLQLDIVDESIIHPDESNRHPDEALPDITTEITIKNPASEKIPPDIAAENAQSRQEFNDTFPREEEASPVELPRKIDLTNPDDKLAYALELQQSRQQRAANSPWLNVGQWLTPRQGISKEDMQRVLWMLTKTIGLPEPASDSLRKRWPEHLAAMYTEAGGKWKLLEAAFEKIRDTDEKYRGDISKWAEKFVLAERQEKTGIQAWRAR